MGMTRKQAEILDFIRDFLGAHSYSPTLDEIARHFDLAPATVFEHVRGLEKSGHLRTARNKARSIEVIGSNADPLTWPIVGRIAAGAPIEAVPQNEVLDLRALFADREDTYLLEVRGHSMIEDHIQDGDLVIVRRSQQARLGDTVVALLRGEEATLKKFYLEKDRVRLEPANASMKPIYASREEVQIQGVVVGVIRQF